MPDDWSAIVSIDDDASALYAEAGIALGLGVDHPFVLAEQARWRSSLERGGVVLAVDAEQRGVGFAALAELDGAAYLDQLSVRRRAMRKGLGRRLLRAAVEWARAGGHGVLTLTTYRHLAWNAPFYAKEGFRPLAEDELTPGIAHHLEEQRRWLPLPHQRVAMAARLRPE